MKIFKRLKKNLVFDILGALLVGLVIVGIFSYFSKSVSAWWDDGWAFRKAITVTVSSSSSDITNLETLLTIDTTGITDKLQTNCEDLRFTNTNGDLLSYYIDSCSDNSATNKIWVIADLVPKNTTTYTLYMYYGNPSASSGSTTSNGLNLLQGLVGYWNMNEGSANTCTGGSNDTCDVSINTNDGAWNGDAANTTGKYSNGVTFDGTGDYVSIPDPGTNSVLDFSNGSSITLSAWIKPTSLPTAGNYTTIITKGAVDGTDDSNYMLQYGNVSSNDIISFCYLQSGTANWKCYETDPDVDVVQTGTWQNITVTYTFGTGSTIKAYYNGILQGGSWIAGDGNDAPSVTNKALWIGADDVSTAGSPNELVDGQIDDTRIYNRALSATEISQLYSNPGTIASTIKTTAKPSTSFASEEKGLGPALYYNFDEGQGTTAQDSTSNNLDGTLNNTPTWTTEDLCISGKCLYFDGANNENVSRADNALLDFAATDNFTVSAWVRKSGASSANTVILGKASANIGSTYQGYKLYMDASGDFCFDTQDGTLAVDTACTSAVEFDDDKWHLVQGVKSGTTSITLYVDGKQKAQDASIASTGSLANSGTFYTGVDSNGTTIEWKGFIDEVKVYSYARSAAQIKLDFNTKAASTSKGSGTTIGVNNQDYLSNGLVGYWKMDDSGIDAEGETSTDSSGNGNTGTLYGDDTVGDNGTGLDCTAVGKFGMGCDLDGVDDYVGMGYSSTLQNLSAMTISAWIYPHTAGQSSTGMIYTSSQANSTIQFHLTSSTYTNAISFNRGYSTQDISRVSSDNTIEMNTWQHVVVTWNGGSNASENLKIYKNGVEVSYQVSTNGEGNLENDAGNPIIGMKNTGTPTRAFDGLIDDVRIYKRALSPKEVSDLYNFAPGPRVNLKMEEGQGSAANDSSGNSNNGTVNSGTWTTGKYGKGVSLNGSSGSNVSVPDFAY